MEKVTFKICKLNWQVQEMDNHLQERTILKIHINHIQNTEMSKIVG